MGTKSKWSWAGSGGPTGVISGPHWRIRNIGLGGNGFGTCRAKDVTNPLATMESSIAPHRMPRNSNPLSIEERVHCAVARLAESDCPVLITGEVGVGKLRIALEIHRLSGKSGESFSHISAAQCDSDCLVSALAASGTVYVSDIADLGFSLQTLLVERYFHAGEFPCRLLCGTAHELADEVKSHRMREDFYHLVSGLTLRILPLRFRRSEILPITEGLLTQYSALYDRPRPILGKEIADFLLHYSWPGNLAELETAIKTVVVIGDNLVSLAALKAGMRGVRPSGTNRPLSLKKATRAASVEVERRMIAEVLRATDGNRKRAADELGISYKALLYKLKQAEAES